MADIRKWDGVLITFNDVDKLISWEAYQDDDDIKTIEYLCYNDFNSLSLGELEINAKAYDHVTWCNDGHALPLYTTFCSGCQNVLTIQTEYCCEDHQIRITLITRLGLLKIMIKQITQDLTLCPYIVLQAHLFYNLELDDIKKLMKIGKEHISLFISTPAGLMLDALQVSGEPL